MFFIPHISLTYLSHHPSYHAHAARSGYAYERLADRRVDVSVNVRVDVRVDVRDESLETPLNKGFLLKNVRDGLL